ncbi:Hypothetical predicted protein [Pelobates cultripes]|uniref:Uncharacterized protein n=1 Tax=Pelobates cultripes TaxID=61616 RepID=A0AAD1R492_PELCU|nr:Hypothetical predicted protein [Pelobates cultripes]
MGPETPKMAEAPSSATRGWTLLQPDSAGPKAEATNTLGAIIDNFWAMLLDRARQAKATQEPDKGEQVRNREQPGRLPTSRQFSRTTPPTLKRQKLRKQRYPLRHRDADRRPAHRCRKTPSPKAPQPVLSYTEKPTWPPLSCPPCRPKLGNPLPSQRAAAWMITNVLDSPVNPVGIG